MKNRFNIILLLCLASSSGLKAQDTTNAFHFEFNKLKPIVQVFATSSYNFDENRYEYGFGRAHLGFQYQFDDKWSSKIIIDRGKGKIGRTNYSKRFSR